MKRSQEPSHSKSRDSDSVKETSPRKASKNISLKTSCQEYEDKFPYFRQPEEIGFFSKDAARKFYHDQSQLKFYVSPKDPGVCELDLRQGYSRMIHKDRNIKEHLDNLLRWIMHNKVAFCLKHAISKGSDGSLNLSTKRKFESLNTDFFCWRGLLTHLACLPYENRDDLIVAVIKFRGSYFMCEFETEAKKVERETETPKQKAMSAWGFKFEQYVTSDKPGGAPNPTCPVNTNEEFGSVARSRLESHSLVYGAEVDCVDLTDNKYLELKTSRIIQNDRQYENFCKFKLIKWWAQSFLIGISKVVCGFRDDNGVVLKLQDYPVFEMPTLAKGALKNPWKPAVCFNFLNEFLNFVKAVVKEDNPRSVHLFRWQPHSNVTYEWRGEDPEFQFLPDWFINWDAWDNWDTWEQT